MRIPLVLLAFLAAPALAQAACSPASSGPARGAPSRGEEPAEVSAAPTEHSSPPASMPEPFPAPERRQVPPFDDVRAALARRCPVGEGLSNVDQKALKEASLECLRQRMVALLDEVLLPLERREPEAFSALMREQATWNRAAAASCRLEEERFWVDWETGRRDDGTMRGHALMNCLERAYVERIYYAEARRAEAARALAARIEALEEEGAAVRRAVAAAEIRALAFAGAPPAHDGLSPRADWMAIAESAALVREATEALARSTCATFPGLARALGGEAPCEAKAERYYYLQGGSPDAGVR